MRKWHNRPIAAFRLAKSSVSDEAISVIGRIPPDSLPAYMKSAPLKLSLSPSVERVRATRLLVASTRTLAHTRLFRSAISMLAWSVDVRMRCGVPVPWGDGDAGKALPLSQG